MVKHNIVLATEIEWRCIVLVPCFLFCFGLWGSMRSLLRGSGCGSAGVHTSVHLSWWWHFDAVGWTTKLERLPSTHTPTYTHPLTEENGKFTSFTSYVKNSFTKWAHRFFQVSHWRMPASRPCGSCAWKTMASRARHLEYNCCFCILQM